MTLSSHRSRPRDPGPPRAPPPPPPLSQRYRDPLRPPGPSPAASAALPLLAPPPPRADWSAPSAGEEGAEQQEGRANESTRGRGREGRTNERAGVEGAEQREWGTNESAGEKGEEAGGGKSHVAMVGEGKRSRGYGDDMGALWGRGIWGRYGVIGMIWGCYGDMGVWRCGE